MSPPGRTPSGMRGPPGDSRFKLSAFLTRLKRSPPRGWPDLIASRIPPSLGGSIARNNDNVYCLGPLEGFLDASRVPPGGLWGCLGGLREAILGLLGASWAPRRPRSYKNSQGRPQTSFKTTPRDSKWPPKASQQRPQRPPRGPKRP